MCDWLAGEVLVFDAQDGSEVVTSVPGLPFSDRLAAGWPARRYHAKRGSGSPEQKPDGASGRPLNEIVVDASGRVWVDMPGSMPGKERKPGTVTLVLPDGSSRQAADDVWFPNGMVISRRRHPRACRVARGPVDGLDGHREGDLVDRGVWVELGPGSDCICADASGANWYVSLPGHYCKRVATCGGMLDTVETDRSCFACVLGCDDGRSLFVVANRHGDGGA